MQGLCSLRSRACSICACCLMHRTSLSNFFLPVLSWGPKQGYKASILCMQHGSCREDAAGAPCPTGDRAAGLCVHQELFPPVGGGEKGTGPGLGCSSSSR